jgi:hypothetical protein
MIASIFHISGLDFRECDNDDVRSRIYEALDYCFASRGSDLEGAALMVSQVMSKFNPPMKLALSVNQCVVLMSEAHHLKTISEKVAWYKSLIAAAGIVRVDAQDCDNVGFKLQKIGVSRDFLYCFLEGCFEVRSKFEFQQIVTTAGTQTQSTVTGFSVTDMTLKDPSVFRLIEAAGDTSNVTLPEVLAVFLQSSDERVVNGPGGQTVPPVKAEIERVMVLPFGPANDRSTEEYSLIMEFNFAHGHMTATVGDGPPKDGLFGWEKPIRLNDALIEPRAEDDDEAELQVVAAFYMKRSTLSMWGKQQSTHRRLSLVCRQWHDNSPLPWPLIDMVAVFEGDMYPAFAPLPRKNANTFTYPPKVTCNALVAQTLRILDLLPLTTCTYNPRLEGRQKRYNSGVVGT